MAAPAQRETQQEVREQTRETRPGADPGRGARAVLWIGIALGITVLVVAWRHGIRLRLPLRPALLAGFGGFLVEAAVVTGLGVWAAHLMRRHHRAAIRYTARTTVTSVRKAAAGAGRAQEWAAPRWAERGDAWRAPLFITRPGRGADGEGFTEGDGPDPGSHERSSDTVARELEPAAVPAPAPATTADAPAPAPATDGTDGTDGGDMTPPARPADAAPSTRHARTLQAPGAWGALVTDTAEFEAGDETELLEWMAVQVEGMLRYGEAIAEMHEHHLSAAVRLDVAAMAMMRDVAEGATEAASVMAQARERFKEVYEAPRGFVADGGVLPQDGDFLTGDDDA